jgi:hypothetical protein
MPNTWEANGRHIIRADVDERRRISNGDGKRHVYLSEDEEGDDSTHDRKLGPKENVVIDTTVHLYGYGPRITVEHTDEKVAKPKKPRAKITGKKRK